MTSTPLSWHTVYARFAENAHGGIAAGINEASESATQRLVEEQSARSRRRAHNYDTIRRVVLLRYIFQQYNRNGDGHSFLGNVTGADRTGSQPKEATPRCCKRAVVGTQRRRRRTHMGWRARRTRSPPGGTAPPTSPTPTCRSRLPGNRRRRRRRRCCCCSAASPSRHGRRRPLSRSRRRRYFLHGLLPMPSLLLLLLLLLLLPLTLRRRRQRYPRLPRLPRRRGRRRSRCRPRSRSSWNGQS